MSHFVTYVIHPWWENEPLPCLDEYDGQGFLADVLAPYDENRRVAPYRSYMDERGIEHMRTYYSKPQPVTDTKTGIHQFREAVIPAEGPLTDLVPYLEEWMGQTGGIDEEGRLYTWSTYNPDSKWDYYLVGGRYEGYPCEEYRRKDSCTHDPESLSFDCADSCWEKVEHHVATCEETDHNVRWLHDIPHEPYAVPFAIVTTDGAWNEKGEMGWWGITTNEKDKDDWNAQAYAIFARELEKNPHAIVVVCDLHI